MNSPSIEIVEHFRKPRRERLTLSSKIARFRNVVSTATALIALGPTACTENFQPSGRYISSASAGRDAGFSDGGQKTDGAVRDGTVMIDDGGDSGLRKDGSEGDAGKGDAGERIDAGTDAGFPVCPPQRCTTGVGKCETSGRVICDKNGNIIDCDAVAGEPDEREVCGDGIDNNCNNHTDEDCVCMPEQTQPCYTGAAETRNRGACHDGLQACDAAANRWADLCDGEQKPEDEHCNSLDDDCNGETDEDCGLGESCARGEGACRTEGIIELDGEGSTRCNAIPREPAEAEICGDGIDNDCRDGIDNGCECNLGNRQACYQGELGTRGIGECRDGSQLCIDGHWRNDCEDQILSSREICDRRDNDCDGVSDENIERSCETMCGVGVEMCRDGIFQECTAPQPRPEECNGRDDNCNDVTDEGCVCSNGIGVCTRNGVIQPDGSCNARPGEPGLEICNGVDDDCNGVTDETFPEQSQPCTVGQGACENSGIVICRNPELGAHCSVLPGTPHSEECNEIDDNCNGITDEGCSCSVGIGVCERRGIIQPDGSCDARPGEPGLEICNGVDDDCNGITDETFPEQGLCTVGVGECRRTGTMVCDPGSPAGDTHCDVEPGAPGLEICNGLDDDCDGRIDINPAIGAPLTQPCGSGCANRVCEGGVYGACGPDRDGDGIPNCDDTCPDTPDDGQDANWNLTGDACDAFMDFLSCTNVASSPNPIVGVDPTRADRLLITLSTCGNIFFDPGDGGITRFYHNIGNNPLRAESRPLGYGSAGSGSLTRTCGGQTNWNAEDIRTRGNCVEFIVP